MSFLSFLSKIRIGIGSATAWLHLPAGKNEAGGAPMKFDPGVLMDAIELGAIEFDGKDWWITVEEDEEDPPEELPYALIANVLQLDNETEYTPSADYHPATKKYVDENSGGGGGFKVETIAMPITGWAADTTYTDFYSITIDISNTLASTSFGIVSPLVTSTAVADAWGELGVVRAERVSDTSIKIITKVENTVAFNFELKVLEGDASSQGTIIVSAGPSAAIPFEGDPLGGGTKTIDGEYTIRTFTSTDLLEVFDTKAISILVIAGGGGAASPGAGAGGLIYEIGYSIPKGAYTITIGAGGSGSNSKGNDSSVGLLLVAEGGGWSYTTHGGDGGSGGGGYEEGDSGGEGNAGPPRQGYNGGTGYTVSGSDDAHAGGGGAGGNGGDGSISHGGDGGIGRLIDISGAGIWYAGGGAGMGDASYPIPNGSAQPGGTEYGDDGAANKGAGAGGYGNGGSGIVIIKYLT